jgi:hypothetical protein
VIGAVSGGVDSTVAAVLMNKAIGHRFHAVLVDNGCLRKDEATKVLKRLREDCGIDLHCHDAADLFLGKLKGITEPEQKRKIIGGTFIEVFQIEADKIIKDAGRCDFLLQGTLYPDVIESISYVREREEGAAREREEGAAREREEGAARERSERKQAAAATRVPRRAHANKVLRAREASATKVLLLLAFLDALAQSRCCCYSRS